MLSRIWKTEAHQDRVLKLLMPQRHARSIQTSIQCVLNVYLLKI
ncbi:hypothetical protein HanRHA438_Chr16g0741371 [Helianthus annuus]|nr:hypothetical protein HanHA300_Chr16g0594371 [Helianthus annuus]KAJ0459063.1 hypothetical protein HanHA89_Chr16g0644681 [Helianthus annuus]KAJ0639616.1 hypothetical protein HanLR1_Chr16g0605791 [Helianthus annuus]KAJ0834234.1 hypothetical protein HanRHA438_Chr16g0741371 [Helianthus annuus]